MELEVRDMIQCPHCGGRIEAITQLCKHCERSVGDAPAVVSGDAATGASPASSPVLVKPRRLAIPVALTVAAIVGSIVMIAMRDHSLIRSVLPPGTTWWCAPHRPSIYANEDQCGRTVQDCDPEVHHGDRRASDSDCTERATAWCYTYHYRDSSNESREVRCYNSADACRTRREAMEHDAAISERSGCEEIGRVEGPR